MCSQIYFKTDPPPPQPARSESCLRCFAPKQGLASVQQLAEVSLNTTPNKQQWTTFETHAQRTKGQTTEQSLADIDKFIAQGKTEDGRAIEQVETTSKTTSEINKLMARNGIKGVEMKSYVVQGSQGTGQAKTKSVTETVTETTFHVEGERKDGLIAHNDVNKLMKPEMATGGNANSFFDQYKNQESAKFKPGYANRNPNGVN